MTILAIRTDKLEAELYVYKDQAHQAKLIWPAHRQLAETLNAKIDEILKQSSISYSQLDGIVVYQGPGSFTGLRIGLSVANGLAFGLKLPIVAAGGDNWQTKAVQKLLDGQNDKIALPDYGSPPHITNPKK
jgi:tRNA threonylcarbamoyladenosine biosynthesis protein TsaB